MDKNDQVTRAYASLLSLKNNIPQNFKLEEKWVLDFNSEIAALETSLGLKLDQFRVPVSDLKKSVASENILTGEIDYKRGQWCERSRLLLKLDAILNYFSILNSPKGTKIGFQTCSDGQ